MGTIEHTIDDTCILSFTECPPVGDLRDIEADDKPHNEYGLYIMPLPIHYTSGILTSVTSNGFYDASLQNNAIRFVLFRQINGSYCNYHIDSTPIAPNGSVHSTITILVDRRVMAGDMIGLQNFKDCNLNNNICFQPAIQSNNTNDTVLYSSTSQFSDLVPLSGVYLNMQASITGKLTQCCIVTGFLMYTFSLADCSLHFVGELINLQSQSISNTENGLYVLPESIQSSGILLTIEAIGSIGGDGTYPLQVLLYHQLGNGALQLYYKNTTLHNKRLETGYGFARADLNVSVTKGDRIGVQMVPGCQTRRCSFQPAFNVSNCFAQVLFNADRDVNNLETIINAFLNVRASIGKSQSCCPCS